MKQIFHKLFCSSLFIMMAGTLAFSQNLVTVSGKVLDAKTNEPVLGAVVMVDGTKTAAVVDNGGRYEIKAASNATLVCSCLGYTEIKQAVNGRSAIDFAMAEDSQMLEETVVVGYGTLKKSQLVGSVDNVSGEVLEDRANSNITRSLQGQVAGLNIIQSDGKPTHGGSVYVRGGATSYISRGASGGSKTSYSIGQGGSALVLIDGVEGTLSSVNPEDVESVSVLKDASSSVIYGARAAYGVILVTTKNATQEKISVTYSGSVSLNSRTVHWEDNIISDGLSYVETMYDHWIGYSETPTAEGKKPTKMNIYTIPSDYLDRYREFVSSGNAPYADLSSGSYVYYGYNMNYLSEFYKKYNTTNQHNISVSGSSKNVSYNISGRYYTQDGIYKIGNEDYDSYNLHSKITVRANDWLTFDNNTSFYKMDYTQPIFSKKLDSGVGSQLWQISMMGFPVIPTTNEDGTYTVGAAAGGYEAFNEGNSNQEDSRTNISTTLGLTIEPFKDVFKIRGDISYKYIDRQLDRYVAPSYYSTAPGTSTNYTGQADSYKQYYNYKTNYISSNIVGTFTPKLGENHNLNIVAGWNLENYNYNRIGILRLGTLYPEKSNFELMDGSEVTLTQDGSSYGLIGFFGRANYTFLRRYIVEFSARYDGSSKFPSNQKWGFFPSASVGWRVSDEPWMKGTKNWLNNLKIRANAGSLGNGTISPYSYLTTMGLDKTSAIFDGALVSKVGNPSVVPDNLTWETVTTYDGGLDIDILKSRLSFSGDYYVRDTDNLYVTGPEIPATFGSSTPKGNYGALQTKGWELTLSWKDQFNMAGKPLAYNIKASLWDSRTWVTKFYNGSDGMFNYYEGKELGEIWGFRTDGIFYSNEEAAAWYKDEFHNFVPTSGPYAGDLKFLDTNGDKVINTGSWTLEDHGDLERIGNEMPRYQFGLNLDFRWNGLGLSAFIQGVGKRDWYPSQGSDFYWGGYSRAYCAYVLKDQAGNNHAILDKTTENWTVSNYDENPYWTRRTYGTANSATGALTFPNDHFLLNAAYVRLKTLTLDYTIPEKLTKKAMINKLRIYLTGENLFTWSPMFKYTTMFDPEVIENGDSDFHSGTSTSMGDGYSYPMLRTYTLGLSLTF